MSYCIAPGYTSRAEPEYHRDSGSGIVWQPDVYPVAAAIGGRLCSTRLIDLGCGYAHKLVPLARRFDIIGIDIGDNIAYCRQQHNAGTWIEHDLDEGGPLPVPVDRSVIVCADVVEHLRHPDLLLDTLRETLADADAVVISTPDRELTRGRGDMGPPANPCHAREWTCSEFGSFLQERGFEHFVLGMTRSSDRDRDRRTIFARCYASDETTFTGEGWQ